MSDRASGTGVLERRELSNSELERLAASRPAVDAAKGIEDFAAFDVLDAEALAEASGRMNAPIHVYPYRAIAFIYVERPQHFAIRGTAFFISEYVLATAAHNLPDDLTSISVYVQLDGDASVLPYVTTDYRISARYAFDPRDDYGAILLDQDVGSATGWFVVPTHITAPPKNTQVLMSGYPSPGFRQREGAGEVVKVDTHTLLYGIDTEFGDSGAPIWRPTPGLPLLTGIHRAENGIAVPITLPVVNELNGWIDEAT